MPLQAVEAMCTAYGLCKQLAHAVQTCVWNAPPQHTDILILNLNHKSVKPNCNTQN
jgi:hypothetical protein